MKLRFLDTMGCVVSFLLFNFSICRRVNVGFNPVPPLESEITLEIAVVKLVECRREHSNTAHLHLPIVQIC